MIEWLDKTKALRCDYNVKDASAYWLQIMRACR